MRRAAAVKLIAGIIVLGSVRAGFGFGLWASGSYHPVGARATAMGGAFTAIADDATAVYWNPAGITQLRRPEISLVGQYFGLAAKSNLTRQNRRLDDTNVNFASFAYPLRSEELKNITLGGHYMRSGLRGFYLITEHTGSAHAIGEVKHDGYIEIFGASMGIDITKNLATGLTGGYQQGITKGQGTLAEYSDATFTNISSTTKTNYKGDISDLWLGFGFLWKLTPELKLGLNFNRAFGDYGLEVVSDNPNWGNLPMGKTKASSAGSIGLSWRANDKLTLAFDFSKMGSRWAGLDTTAYRTGAEYIIPVGKTVKAIPLRAGYFYDDYRMVNQWIVTDTDGKGTGNFGTFGFGLVFADFQIETAFEYGKRKLGDLAYTLSYPANFRSAINRDQEDTIKRLLWSIIYYF
ncbi:MAG: hypothetical protein HY747_09385 [Elusimicrobia bacterium]|nr:hypothetical protein [Elusimicrobiota bacterium]